MSDFSELQNKHERLLSAQIAKEIKKSEAQEFIDEIVAGGKKISSPRERDQLRANLRYWANYVYEETGSYPSTELLPSNTSILSSVLAGILVIVIFAAASYFGTKRWQSYVISLTPVVTPTLECPVQPASRLLVPPSDTPTKFVVVLFDQSGSYFQYTKESIDLVKNTLLQEIGTGDRLVMAWIDSGISGRTIFFDEKVQVANFPATPPTPAFVLTPTLTAEGSSMQQLAVQATNVAIEASNQGIVQQSYSCEIGKWNSEYEKLYTSWLSQQSEIEDEFRSKAQDALNGSMSTAPTSNTAVYESLYLTSRLFSSSIDQGEYDNYFLIVFSDLEDTTGSEPLDGLNIDLSEVNVIVTQYCEINAIECSTRADYWEKEFLSFGVRKISLLLPYQSTQEELIRLIRSSAP